MSIINNTYKLEALLEQANALPVKAEQATPVISVNTSGLITATAGTKSSTHQLAFQPAKTITPSTASQVAVSNGYYTGGNVTVAGDSNLVAGNIKSGVSIFGVTGTYVGSGGGDTNAEDALITMAMSEYTNSRISNIGNGAFAYASNLTSVNFPKCTTIGSTAFYQCFKLTTVSFPVATTINSRAFGNCNNLASIAFPVCPSIGYSAFYYCITLTTVSFPEVIIIGDCAFSYCINLTSVNFPKCTTIGSSAFFSCFNLTTVSFPVATSIGNGAFYSCSKLTTVSFPVATNISDQAFFSCFNLTTVSFPVATNIGYSAFAYCSKLTTVSFPEVISISGRAFERCYNLKSLYLTGSSLCKLSNSNAFTYTPIGGYSTSAGTYGSIYVPASLLTSYQTATNWTYFSSRFVVYDNLPNLPT